MNLEPILQSELSQRKINIVYECIHTESRKMVLKDLFAGQQWKIRNREQTYGHGEKGGEGEMYGKSSMETTTTTKRLRTCNARYLLYAFVLIYYLSSQSSKQLRKEVVIITLILRVTEFRPRS